MHASTSIVRSLILVTLLGSGAGCFGRDEGAGEPARARARAEDPALTHTWNLPAGSSRVVQGDLGSKPPELADALMNNGAMPSFAHQAASSCDAKGALKTAGDVALRFEITNGTLSAVHGDPPGPAADCFAAMLGEQASLFESVPEGRGLVRFQLSAPPTEG